MTEINNPKERTERYRQLLNETIVSLDHSAETAKGTLPKMWDELKGQGIERLQARAIMKEDFGERWGEWSLIKFLPEEAKDPSRVIGGIASAEAREKRRLYQESKQMTYPHRIVLEDKEAVDRTIKGMMQLRLENVTRMEIVEVAPGDVRIQGLETIKAIN